MGLIGASQPTTTAVGALKNIWTIDPPPASTPYNTGSQAITQNQLPPAQTYTPERVPGAIQAQVDPNTGTVEGRIRGLIEQNNPLMQLAETRGQQYAATRGLKNSSMEAGAMQDAVLSAAMPIAQSDAAAQNQFALENANAQNKNAALNAGYANEAGQFGAQQQNAMSTMDRQLANTRIISQMDNASREKLADIEQKYRTTIEGSKISSDLINRSLDLLNNIQQSTTMDAETKQRNIDAMWKTVYIGLGINDALTGIDSAGMLDFGYLDPKTPATQTPTA